VTDEEVIRVTRAELEAAGVPLEQQGDCWQEAHASRNGEDQRRRITAADVATIDDLIRAGSEMRWLWPGWVPIGVLTALPSEGGKGKTGFCADLERRIRHQMPWPDGSSMTAPADALSLWVLSDNHHDEMVTLAREFDIVPSIRINALRSDPYGGVTLENAEDLGALDSRIAAVRPLLVIVDTVGNSTDKNLAKQEDAKAYYAPLQVLARRHACAFLCLTHLNAGGTFLGRRVMEKVRVGVRIMQPGADEKRRLEVVKTNSRKPAALGLTLGDRGNEYDDNPPELPSEDATPRPGLGRPSSEIQVCADWLAALLEGGPCRVSITRNEASQAGFCVGTLYNAKRLLGLEEYESEGRKWWRLRENGNPFA